MSAHPNNLPTEYKSMIIRYMTNLKWLERLRNIPQDKANRDNMKIDDLVSKAEEENKKIRTMLNNHLRFDDMISDIKAGKLKISA